MAYDSDLGSLQGIIKQIEKRTWKNDVTRLNQTNMNNIEYDIANIADALCDSNGNGVIQKLDDVKRLVSNNDKIDYTVNSFYTQLTNLNHALFGTDSRMDYQEVTDTAKNYFCSPIDKSGGILNNLVWFYDNDYTKTVKALNKTRSIFRDGSVYTKGSLDTNTSGSYSSDTTNVIKYGMYLTSDITGNGAAWVGINSKAINKGRLQLYSGTGVEFGGAENDTGSNDGNTITNTVDVYFNNALQIDKSGNILPQENATLTLGNADYCFNEGYFNNLYSPNILSDSIYAKGIYVTTTGTSNGAANQGTTDASVVVYKTLKAEESRAFAAEIAIQEALSEETQNRQSADATLDTRLTEETHNRTAADANLQASIDLINNVTALIIDGGTAKNVNDF